MKLNVNTAREYVENHLCEIGLEDVEIGAITPMKKIGEPPIIQIAFRYRSEHSESGWYTGIFDVWLQDGKLYGEW